MVLVSAAITTHTADLLEEEAFVLFLRIVIVWCDGIRWHDLIVISSLFALCFVMMLFCFLINQRRRRSISSSLFSLFLVELLAKMMVSQVTKKFNGNFGEQGHVWLIGTWLLRFWLDFFKKFQTTTRNTTNQTSQQQTAPRCEATEANNIKRKSFIIDNGRTKY